MWRFAPASPDDFERLLDLRIRAMRPSLERLGRFQPERARVRFQEAFDPSTFRLIVEEQECVGCVRLYRDSDAFVIGSFYIEPTHQGKGLGSSVLQALIEEVQPTGLPIRLCVLKESPAQRLYQRFGFVKIEEEEWDETFERSGSGGVCF